MLLETTWSRKLEGRGGLYDLLREGRADVGDAQLVHEELRELEGPAGEVGGRGRVRRVLEEFRVELLDHRHARTGGADDHLGAAEDLQGADRAAAGDVPLAGVEGGLAAARLLRAELDLVAEPLQHPDRGHADLGGQLVDETRDEEGDAHGISAGTPRGGRRRR